MASPSHKWNHQWNHQFITVQMNHYNIDITGINERADKLTLESEVKQLYDHAVEVLNWIN